MADLVTPGSDLAVVEKGTSAQQQQHSMPVQRVVDPGNATPMLWRSMQS